MRRKRREEKAETQRAKVLLAYFETLERFDAWVAVSNLWESHFFAGVSDYLCARLYREASDESVERYLESNRDDVDAEIGGWDDRGREGGRVSSG